MEESVAYLILNMVRHIGPIRARNLIEIFGTARGVLDAKPGEIDLVQGLGKEAKESLLHWRKSINWERELQNIRDFGCHIVTLDQANYPKALREIYDPPLALYVKGSLECLNQSAFAVVGSRLTTTYGRQVARKLGQQIGALDLVLTSGGARGIDTDAHAGVLDVKGKTIAVLGTGINVVWPPENAELFDQIVVGGGALVTQFPFNRKGDKKSFPIRNRIVAGMTLGTIVVEANLTSGALITANLAADYGRPVFAVPGPVFSPRSKGCHQLLRNGAILCETIEDVLTEYEYLFPKPKPQSPSPEGEQLRLELTPPQHPKTPSLSLSSAEEEVLRILAGGETSLDSLCDHLGKPAGALAALLSKMEIKHLIKTMPGGRFKRACS